MTEAEEIEEVMARVRRLELRARRLVKETFAGEYHSSFKGQGLDFDEFRPYQHGDETRFIDWNVTARMREPYIRKFREERELSVILVVDVSASMLYGSEFRSKRELAAEVAAILGFSARHNGDKVGLLLFADEQFLYLQPAKGNKQILRAVREILMAQSSKGPTDISEVCHFLMNTVRRKSLIFFLSDFLGMEMRKPMATLAQRHEVVALRIADPAEKQIPDVGKVVLSDIELGYERLLNTSNTNVRMSMKKLSARFEEGLVKIMSRSGIEYETLYTDRDYFATLHSLFERRSRRHA